jgi:hypothetical protein
VEEEEEEEEEEEDLCPYRLCGGVAAFPGLINSAFVGDLTVMDFRMHSAAIKIMITIIQLTL